ncbi:related beta-lactamase [Fusarium fujikuroi]|uniref:Related beta-lactamase n=2 Tax=Fusarium fujikuroi TaxID=5127 RepID=S0EFZ6_GIBF5|nr:related beta-lactamase [Fusarium fujikuroi IMI 58289]KLP10322.1 hypothetical protein Y057_1925 [Fusarium fujikuroi]QGI68400.1 hypothetical protein CEK27_012371 [Fusarium fujikuroi]QGI99292.1 hypothetical protein CEK26_012361 [Fusarium fujikuroi]CCT72767.1 related beta-lactamase [Fusarium fujikuroi IMI 58289]SCN77488.1 related beta-lactamase [Fusarium fujikuroi]
MALATQTVTQLESVIDKSVNDPKGIPGVAVVVVGRNGELFSHAAGKRGLDSSEPMTVDNVFWLASSTKMVTGIAIMHLVEHGGLNLDDADQLESLIPELKDIQVAQSDGTLAPKTSRITLRMLLTHTSGFGYSIFNKLLLPYAEEIGSDEASPQFPFLKMPLAFNPGEDFAYGSGIDVAAIALERASGLALGGYLDKHVFGPLGIKDISFVPSQSMRGRLASMHQRDSNGNLLVRDSPFKANAEVDLNSAEAVAAVEHSGGGGLFATPQEYANSRTGKQVLSKSIIDDMFTNQIPQFPNFARAGLQSARPDLTHEIPEFYPVPGNPPQGWGLTFLMSNGGATGRSTKTGHWAGLPNVWWWCDPETGVAGIVATQILPFGDPKVLELWGTVEAVVTAAMKD